jgi:hypothetical protein
MDTNDSNTRPAGRHAAPREERLARTLARKQRAAHRARVVRAVRREDAREAAGYGVMFR